ncbi:MAG: hypothetical protein Hens3KO_27950 [Henriciella sp.]
MREDMFKVIVERPRLGRKHAPRSKLRYNKCPDRKCASGRRIVLEHAGYTKDLNENLAPLRRYLNKQVGRPWNKVFSEICQSLDTGSTVKQHVRDHLTDFILVKVSVDETGRVFSANHWGQPVPPEQWWAKLYVDPKDGLIKRTDKLCRKLGLVPYRDAIRVARKRRVQPERTLALSRESPTRIYAKLNGHWFAVTFDRKPVSRFGIELSDTDLLLVLANPGEIESQTWRVTSKRQLSKKALRTLRLANEF